MSTWTEQRTAKASPDAVLDVLTDPGACQRWAPVGFDVALPAGERLQAGTRTRVAGRLAGQHVAFDVRVLAADRERLTLTASGPIDLDVEYRLRASDAGSDLQARIDVTGGGLAGRLLAQATSALLAAGALRCALSRIASEAEALVAPAV